MSYVQIQPGGKANAKGAKYVNLAWNEWDSDKKRAVQRRFYVGRLVGDDDGEVLLNKRFSGGREVRVALADIQARAAHRAGFEAWLWEIGGRGTLADGVARIDIVGDAWLCVCLAEATGLAETLRLCFGDADGGALAGLAAHQFITGHALYRAGDWLEQREVPESWRSQQTSSAAVHGFVARIGEDVSRREAFMEHWVGRNGGGPYSRSGVMNQAAPTGRRLQTRSRAQLPQFKALCEILTRQKKAWYRHLMCLAVPMRIVELLDERSGTAELDGLRHAVDISLVENPRIGDFVIVHAGFAIEKLDVEEANTRIALFEELAVSNAGEQSDGLTS